MSIACHGLHGYSLELQLTNRIHLSPKSRFVFIQVFKSFEFVTYESQVTNLHRAYRFSTELTESNLPINGHNDPGYSKSNLL